jgi:hypothetical protein
MQGFNIGSLTILAVSYFVRRTRECVCAKEIFLVAVGEQRKIGIVVC